MTQNKLSFVVLICYATVSLLGVAIAIAGIRTPRYFPVITLMGFGIGTPAIGLAVIRLARIFGYTTNPNDPSQQIIIIVSFLFTIVCMLNALTLVIKEGQHLARERVRERARMAELEQLRGC